MQILPVLPRLEIRVYPSQKGEDKIYGAFNLIGLTKKHYPTIDYSIEAESKDLGGFDHPKPEQDIPKEDLPLYLLSKSNQKTKVTSCFNCNNLVYQDSGRFPENAICPTCALAFYNQQERIAKEINTKKEQREDVAQKIALNTHLPVTLLEQFLLFRPRLLNVMQNIRLAKIERSTEEIAPRIRISNDVEPLFNIGRWGDPHYDSCQDWMDSKWSDVYQRSMHQLEDPDVLVLWYGEEDEMFSRCLVRKMVDVKTGELLIGVDAWYGDRENETAMLTALQEFATRDGSRVVMIRSASAESTAKSRNLAYFSNKIGSYADIGRWMKTGSGAMTHLCGYVSYIPKDGTEVNTVTADDTDNWDDLVGGA